MRQGRRVSISDLPVAKLDRECPPTSSESRLYRFEVSFTGPPMIRRIRCALSAAAITPLVDRHANAASLRDGASELHEFVVSVRSQDADQAIKQTRGAVEAGGAYAGFSVTPDS
jgi:hypothetical protein